MSLVYPWFRFAFQTKNFMFFSCQELQKHGSPDIVMALVGNKADLQDNREVPTQVSI